MEARQGAAASGDALLTPPRVTIRKARPGPRERAFVRRLSGEVFARFGEYDTWLPDVTRHPDVLTLIAEADGGPIGFALVAFDEAVPGEAELLAIAVAPGWQCRGVGRRLLAAAEERARGRAATGPAALRLTVAEDNLPALRLFREAGYVRDARPAGRYPGGQRSLEYRRELPPGPSGA